MRYFKIYNSNVTKTQPRKELTEDQFLATIADYCISVLDENAPNYEERLEELYSEAFNLAAYKGGFCFRNYYLYATEDKNITATDFNRKGA